MLAEKRRGLLLAITMNVEVAGNFLWESKEVPDTFLGASFILANN